jgi:4-alpha-glucanotransferase
MMNRMTESAANSGLQHLAQAAGFMTHWQDVFGVQHEVKDDVLRDLLAAMGLPANNAAHIADSLGLLEQDAQAQSAGLLITDQGTAPVFPWSGPPAYRVTLESGRTLAGFVSHAGPGMVRIAPVQEVGYHVLEIGDSHRMLAVCPVHCPSIEQRMVARHRESSPPWGLAAQIYSLRGSGAHQGGDFTLLARLAEEAARHGAAALAISPVHAMFSAAPSRYSPYSPSNRLFLNAGYVDPAQALDIAAVAGDMGNAREQLGGAPKDADHVNWEQAQPQRLRLLRLAYESFRKRDAHPLAAQMQAFRDREGQSLHRHALFETLHALHAQGLGPEHGWQDWPAALRDPSSPAVANLAKQHAEEVGFHVFLQWLAHRGMHTAQQRALDAGMPIGLIADLAIGTDPRGSHAWSSQREILSGVSLGASPDLYYPEGQDWGLTAVSPRALRFGHYASFIALLRAAFAIAGGLRIDHILGLVRMWVIAPGASAADGAYLRYPVEDMLRLLTLEAWRNQAIVIGENLGTVPEGLNAQLAAKGILGMNVLWFQRQDKKTGDNDSASSKPVFVPPSRWPSAAVAMTTTHDLPTVAGWWTGRDLYWRDRLSPDEAKPEPVSAQEARKEEKAALWASMHLPGTIEDCPCASAPPAEPPVSSILCHVASAPCPMFIAPLEDLLGMPEQPNFPGGHKDYPSWIQRLPLSVDAIFKDDAVLRRIAAIKRGRAKS